MCKKSICPNCKSANISDDSSRANNGKFGVGFESWILKVQYVCNDCGVIFKPIIK